jgi:hypothetical protein
MVLLFGHSHRGADVVKYSALDQKRQRNGRCYSTLVYYPLQKSERC